MSSRAKVALAGCSIPEIAAEMGVTEKTIDRRLRDDTLFHDVYQRGNERGKAAVRIGQFKKALAGDTNMLIYQGKQRLGQTERREIGIMELGGTDSRPSLQPMPRQLRPG